MTKVTYYSPNAVSPGSGATGMAVDLNADPIWLNTGSGLRGHSWRYTLGSASVSGVGLDEARECTATMDCVDLAQWDRARRVFDADLTALSRSDNARPGVIGVDGWECDALVVSHEPDRITPGWLQGKLTVLLLGKWRTWGESDVTSFNPRNDTGEQWLDLPTDMAFDLTGMQRINIVHNPMMERMPFRMVVYGPVTNPGVQIGDNYYQVNVTVPEQGSLTIISITRQKSVILRDRYGNETDVFDKAERGSGLDGGRYIFQPIPPGDSRVEWSGDYGFDLTVVREDTEPPWSTS
ncbi:hypothetical protein EMO89_01695 [Bifidobacterium tissieri]|uniref:Uncharacterized protein n=1 Tax=Bifidobacterium tissieri TaxID=1630162 RepID=A0A5M9ZV29_9BIFI|nr:hypothetical protein [Bifidobacterium tissieri]KAA8831474.1 hypothetical protein EMO89_01695 [Bifidobacterium tissieri]